MLRTYYLSIDQDIITPKGEKQSFRFEKEIEIRLCKNQGNKSSYHSGHDDIFMGNTYLDFELNLSYIQLIVDQPWRKAKELIRVLEHRFDWILVKINGTIGQPVSIVNKEEIITNWKKMKDTLQQTYVGKAVETHLEKIGTESFSCQNIWPCFSDYNHFGFLFPPVPLYRSKNWIKTREMNLANRIIFGETIELSKSVGNMEYFSVKGGLEKVVLFDNKAVELKKYDGIFIIPQGDIIPKEGDIEIVYASGNNLFEWQFHLEEIED